jgi:hypothetical protein
MRPETQLEQRMLSGNNSLANIAAKEDGRI